METSTETVRSPNPRKGANLFSVLTFAYTLPTFREGFKKEFQEEDITETLNEHKSERLGDRLEEAWFKQAKQNKPSLWKALANVFGLNYFLLGLILFVEEIIIKISQPLALSQLIQYYTQGKDEVSLNEAYMYAGFIVGASFLNVLMGHLYLLALQHFGMKLRVACCSLTYRKSLRLSKTVLGGVTIGKLTNLLSNDVHRFDSATLHLHNLWVCPIEVSVILYLLYARVGLVSTIGILFMVLFVPLQMYMGKKMSEYRLRTALKTDERVRLMNEIISGIQVIKMYTWEIPFAKLVAIVRKLEVHQIRRTSYIRALTISFGVFTTRFAVFLTILTYVLTENSLNAEYVFVVMSFYNILQKAMTLHFPKGITELAEVKVSVSRIQKFLTYDEIRGSPRFDVQQNGFGPADEPKPKPARIGIEMKNVSAKWTPESDDTLKNIDLEIGQGELVAVIGPVGSGKTNLLQVILKELPIYEGNVSVTGKVSYASQEPWIFSGSVRQNVLFGEPMDPSRYHEVIRVCGLEHDLNNFPYGDRTLVGERGVMLSGGQKARISLARAVYRKADVYLLDDPLSAVDAHVGKQLFRECVAGFLKGRCAVLVTHQLQYLQNVEKIVLVENGRISAVGNYQELKGSGGEFAKELNDAKEEVDVEVEEKKEKTSAVEENNNDPVEAKEHRTSGAISKGVYVSYFKAGGSTFVVFVILTMCVFTQMSASGADYFIGYWVNLEQARSDANATNADEFADFSRDTCIAIYSSIIGAVIVLTLLRSLSFFSYCMKASINLHNDMFSNIVSTPMRFFDTNSSGRILNRFAKDMGLVDETLPFEMISVIQVALNIIGVTAVISTVKPWLLGVTVALVTIMYLLKIVYIATSRSVKRLEGITRSPVFAHMNASLQGITTIRALGAQQILQNEFDHHQNLHSSVWYLFLTLSRGFGFWLDFLCVLYIAAVTFSFFIMDTEEYGGNVGLAITQAISLTGQFQMGLRQWSELQNNMTAVERVLEYTNLKQEASRTRTVPKIDWPERGSVRFQSVSLRYSPEDPYVLKNLNFAVRPREKVGIVGRTGAGKSSLVYALFQLTETEGSILVDDVDATEVPLHCLRSKISIIPQDPVLFSKTLRKNLDPFDDHPDEVLWNALEEVELKNAVSDLAAGLNHMMAEGGSNFSVGQRQLVCLARAIIRQNRILILDEATANVDPQTDTLIQRTIRRKFADCTVLTIAHRLNTVMDSDRILVMDDGQVVEFDHPYLLLERGCGFLYDMVQQTGLAMAEALTDVARDAYYAKKKFKPEDQ